MPRRTLLLLVSGLLALAGCTRPISHAYTTQTPPPTLPATTSPPPTVPVPAAQQIVFTGAGYHLHSTGRVSQAVSDAAWAGVLETLNKYLELGILTPLRSGGLAGDLTPLFTPLAVDRVLTGPDRFAFIDENLPPAADLRPESMEAGMNALAGPDGGVSVVTAGLDVRIVGHVDGSPLTVVRNGELVLVPEGGTWRIDGWDITVTRTLAQVTTTTTVRS
jgi:hypothetical protein